MVRPPIDRTYVLMDTMLVAAFKIALLKEGHMEATIYLAIYLSSYLASYLASYLQTSH